MILRAASSIYGAASAWRRRWYEEHPARQHHLSRPVLSVGNLRTGGAGKTPIVAALAKGLSQRGERPSILTRGYARRKVTDGVTVVSDGTHVLADVNAAGDEALMLARTLATVPVLVGADRYRSGCYAEEHFGTSIHILDDGFQHFALARDIDLLVVDEDDLSDRLLPAGNLREPLEAASRAHALVTVSQNPATIDRLKHALGVTTLFTVTRKLGQSRLLKGAGSPEVGSSTPVFAVAGIARPHRFVESVKSLGCPVTGTMTFHDHHAYTSSDMRRIQDAARSAGSRLIVTTEKDAVRMEMHDAGELPIAVIPLVAQVDETLFAWIIGRLKL